MRPRARILFSKRENACPVKPKLDAEAVFDRTRYLLARSGTRQRQSSFRAVLLRGGHTRWRTAMFRFPRRVSRASSCRLQDHAVAHPLADLDPGTARPNACSACMARQAPSYRAARSHPTLSAVPHEAIIGKQCERMRRRSILTLSQPSAFDLHPRHVHPLRHLRCFPVPGRR